MFSRDQILIKPKSYGLVHDVCVKKIWVCCSLRCLQMHCFKSSTSYHCISCSFPNNLTNLIFFVLEGWDIAYFARVYYCYCYCYHSCSPYGFFFLHNPYHRYNISIRLIVCMFVTCHGASK